MPRIRCLLCLILAIALILLITYVYSGFPLKTDALIAEKYNCWAGVIRIWIYEGWSPGISCAAGWLNRCATSFEKAHEGVYIQIDSVDASAIEGLCENGVIPPDMIIFPPGLLKDPSHLIPLITNSNTRSELSESGMYKGFTYAQPILMGGYAWAYNTEILDQIPDTWSGTSHSLSLPSNDSHYSYDAAITALCSHRFLLEEEIPLRNAIPRDVDLGLSLEDTTPEPVTTPVPSTGNYEYCVLPEDISSGDIALSDFAAGKTAAIPVAMKDIRYLKNLSDKGRGPEWAIQYSGDMTFTDQILFASVVQNENNAEKETICLDFLNHVLSDESQEAAGTIGACSVTEVYSGYHGSDPFFSIEEALHNLPVYIKSAFDSGGDEPFKLIVRKFLSDRGFSSALYHEIMALSS